jgi:hypothetical protein
MAYVVLDGPLVPIDRMAADRPFYSGKHRMHGMNLQVISTPDGTLLWVSGALPGSVHDTTAAHIWNILAALRQAGLIALGDKGYHADRRAGDHSVQGQGQTRVSESCQPGAREAAWPRRTRQRPSSKPGASCASYAPAPPRRPTRQSHPRPSRPRTRSRIRKAHC